MKMESEIFYESIDMSEITIDETSFAWVVDDELRSRTSSVSGSSHIRSYASIIDSMIRSRTPSSSGTSSVHSFASAGDRKNIATRLSKAVIKETGNFAVDLKSFTMSEIVAATNNFSTENKIGDGSFGVVYGGKLIDGREVAIKRCEISSNRNKFQENVFGYRVSRRLVNEQFKNEHECFSKLHHMNLVRLVGFYADSEERILVYEYIKNGSLSDNLHKLQSSALMSWPMRIKVALDVARGIECLHQYQNTNPPIIHHDINSANILLDVNWNAKLSDFGLSLTGTFPGTAGYLDPQYYWFRHLTPKSDVYSFGVVLLELLSGLTAIHKNENGIPRNVVDFVVPFIVQDEIHKVLDPRVPPPTPFETEAVVYVAYLAADCVRKQGRDRPTMSEVVNSLEEAFTASLAHPIHSTSSSHSFQ